MGSNKDPDTQIDPDTQMLIQAGYRGSVEGAGGYRVPKDHTANFNAQSGASAQNPNTEAGFVAAQGHTTTSAPKYYTPFSTERESSDGLPEAGRFTHLKTNLSDMPSPLDIPTGSTVAQAREIAMENLQNCGLSRRGADAFLSGDPKAVAAIDKVFNGSELMQDVHKIRDQFQNYTAAQGQIPVALVQPAIVPGAPKK